MEVVLPRSVEPSPIAGWSIDKLRIKDCKETAIGTNVVCQGGLIVNQFLNIGGENQPTDLKAIKQLLVKDTTNKFTWRNLLSYKMLFLTFLLTMIVTASTVGAIKLIKDAKDGDSDDDSSEPLPMNFTARFKTRAQWSATELGIEQKNLRYCPAKFVVVAHTAGTQCDKPVICENIIKGIQNYHIESGYGDISYNFLIGGDGYIYEGRGWGKYGAHTYGVNCDSIGVAFIGNYDHIKLRKRSVDAFNLLVEEGVSSEEIEPNYKLFSQAQIINVVSPGLHIKEVIQSWKNSASLAKEDFLCF